MKNNLIQNKSMLSLLDQFQSIYALRYLLTLAGWDTEIYMPSKGIELRSKMQGSAEKLIQKLVLEKDFSRGIQELEEQQADLNVYEKAILRSLLRQRNKYTKLPPAFVEKFANATAKSSTIWAKAKNENNYQLFAPYLKEIFALTKQSADYLGYKKHPYEALIADYEAGMDMDDYEQYFEGLKTVLNKFDLSKVKSQNNLPQDFSIEKLEKLCLHILEIFGVTNDNFRLDQSAHPFTNSLAIDDVRITTNYHKDSPLSAIFSTIHEFGHGLFAQQVNPELEATPIFTDISYAVHESQSRLWENHIGRSKEFITTLLEQIQTLGPEYTNLTIDQVYHAANNVTPSLIRVEADEFTYHYHILIRYEVEKALLDGAIDFSEAAEFWNSKYQEYLGISAQNSAAGILQDIHWSLGYIGYFPTYSMGTVLAATISDKIQAELGDLTKLVVDSAGIAKIKLWLANNIHEFGGTYTYKDITRQLTGKDLSFTAWEQYMANKFTYLLK